MKKGILVACVIMLVAALSSSALAQARGKGTPVPSSVQKAPSQPPPSSSQAGGLPAVDARVQRLEAQVVLLNAAMLSLNSAVSDLQSKVGNLQTAVTNLLNQNHWAVVSPIGNVIRNSGIVAVIAKRLDAGMYEVTFPQNVAGCAYLATIGDPAILATNPGFITVAGDVDGDSPNDVHVQTFDNTGKGADSAFHLYVSCPAVSVSPV